MTGAFLLARKLDQALPPANRNVGVLLPASVGAALVNMGLLLAGKVPVNLNFTIGPEAMQAAIDKAGITHIVAARPFLAKAKLDERPGMVFVEDFMKSIGKGERVFWYLALRLLPVSWIERLAGGGKSTPDDLCTIMFSSGSTGTPKGVMLSHHNIMSNLEAIAQILWIQPDDRMMGVLPFFHSFGFTGTLCLPLLCGIGAIYHPNPLDAKTIGKLAREHGATILISTPTFCQAYYRTCGPEDFKTLRHVVVGAERLRPDFAAQFKEKFGLEMLEGYGATEMGPVVSVNVPNVVHAGEQQVGHKPGTVGHPLPGVAAKVVDPETGQDLTEGQEGLLLLKGPGRMVGYLADEKATAAALARRLVRDRRHRDRGRGRLHQDHRPAVALFQDRRRDGAAPEGRGGDAAHPGRRGGLRHRGARSAARRAAGRLLRRERGDGAAAGVAGAGRVRPAEDLHPQGHRPPAHRDAAGAGQRQDRPARGEGASGRG